MAFALVQGTDALFEGQERFVYLCSVDTSLLVHVHVVGSSLVTCQVDETDLSEHFFAIFEGDLQNGM